MRVLFSPCPFHHTVAGMKYEPVTFLEGEMIEHSDGTVELQRLFDQEEDQQTDPPSTAMSRTLGIDFNGDPTWRPAGTHGPFETGHRVQYGVAYHPHWGPGSEKEPWYIVPVVVLS